ncbi:helix-turn-helix domain-containing protein [Cohnella sp. LGH]|uniref:response regulator transcription factor n=1 Tax=Cohnella sp. LGH TaxID=1619153 RepID=UPI001ADB5BAF|nr:helix-turn-helix domain-containing protein [Cohnella sp. LGH]QTH42693.1 helix-turn-helix domain-containing protein [Cohnella sp. LGH]
MRVLLVEDETIVRRFIKSLIDWDAHGFTVAGEASNGEEAWKILASEQIDIVLTDIRMPVLSGFELIERVAESELACEVIILSSYDDFEYVRTALKLNVSDYVHKATISDEELLGCLNKAKADWLKRQEQAIVMSDRTADVQTLSRQGVVAANLLKMALEVAADRQYLALVSEGLSHWREPFRAALAAATAEASAAAFEDGNVLAFSYGECRIFAGGEGVPASAAGSQSEAVVYDERPISFAEWPSVYASLKRKLDERMEELRQSRSLHGSIRQAVEYLQAHYMGELTMEAVCERVHMSAAYFSRLFQKETGVTFTAYLTNLRLQEAKRLLLQTEYPVYEIAEKAGYRNTRYFMKLFKETVGLTPTEYRERPDQEK